MDHSRRRPSLGTIFGLLALLFAITGAALATTGVFSGKEKRAIRRIARLQANAQLQQQVRTPSRFVLNDPTVHDFDPRESTLLVAKPFTVRARCYDDTPAGQPYLDNAIVDVLGPAGSSFATPGGELVTGNQTKWEVAFNLSDPGENDVTFGQLMAVAPNGETVTVSASVELGDPAGDCVFGVTAIGP